MLKHFKRILITKKEIESKCLELANWVNETYKDSNDFVIVGLLKGSIPFIAQLIKDITIIHRLDFMTISSYEGGIKSSGSPKIIMDLVHSVKGKDVLIVEDLVDTGRTLSTIKEMISQRGANSIRILTLLDKKAGRDTLFEVDKYGFNVENVFLVGFGMDVNGKLRNLPYIGEFDIKYLDKY